MDIRTHISNLRNRVKTSPASRSEIAAAGKGAFSMSWLDKFVVGTKDNPRADTLAALDAAIRNAEKPYMIYKSPVPDSQTPGNRTSVASNLR